jgi:Domain of unknown function (DUF4333)
VRRSVAVALVLAAAAAVAGGCALSDDLDMVKAESALRSEVGRYYGVTVEHIACPDEVPMEEGTTFTCTATVAGQELRVAARQDDDDGNVTFEAEAAVVDLAAKTAEIQAAIAEENPEARPRLYCGDQQVLVVDPGDTFDCLLEGRNVPPRRVVVTVEDVDGSTTFTTG